MTDVILIHSSFKYGEQARGVQFIPPVGLSTLAVPLLKSGMRVRILDLGIHPMTFEEVNTVIREGKAPLVGISANSPQIHNAMRHARAIRREFGDAVTLALGGYHISNDADFLDRHPGIFDFGVRGDGDVTFTDLAARVLGGESICGTFIGESPGDLDAVSPPAYHLTPLEDYRALGLANYPILATRGCPFDCVFCSRSLGSRKVRRRTVDSLLAEIEANYDAFDGHYQFQDESFTLRRDFVLDFCARVPELGRPIRWSAGGVRLDQIDDELLTAMWDAGCRTFFMGIESGSQRVRMDIVGKKYTDEQVFQAFRLLNRYRFKVEISFVLGNPTETEEELRQTAFFPAKLASMGFHCITQVGMKPAVPLPGSRLWTHALEEGQVPRDFIDRYVAGEYGEDFWRTWPKYVPQGMTLDQVRAHRKQGYLKYYLRPRYVLRRMMEDLSNPARLRNDLKNFWSMIRRGHSTVSLTD